MTSGIGIVRSGSETSLPEALASRFENELNKYRNGSVNDSTDSPENHGHGFIRQVGDPVSPTKRRFQSFLKKWNRREDNKEVLFSGTAARLSEYERMEFGAPGSFVTQGPCQVYRLRTSRANFLVCGKVVHPVMKALRVTRVSERSFVLALHNPERFWKMTVKEDGDGLASVLRKVCAYRDEGGEYGTVVEEETEEEEAEELVEQRLQALARARTMHVEKAELTPEASSMATSSSAVLHEIPVPDLKQEAVDETHHVSETDHVGEADHESSDSDADKTLQWRGNSADSCKAASPGSSDDDADRTMAATEVEVVAPKPVFTKPTVRAALLAQPTPIRPASADSVGSVLSKFGVDSEDDRQRWVPGPSWMDTRGRQQLGRDISKRFSLTFKEIRPTAAAAAAPAGRVMTGSGRWLVDDARKTKTTEILRQSRSRYSLTTEKPPAKKASTRFLGLF